MINLTLFGLSVHHLTLMIYLKQEWGLKTEKYQGFFVIRTDLDICMLFMKMWINAFQQNTNKLLFLIFVAIVKCY